MVVPHQALPEAFSNTLVISGLEWAGESPLCTGTADTNKILSESGTCGPRRSLNVFLDQPGSLTGSVWTTPDTVNNEGRYESVTIPLSDLVIHLFATAILVKEPETFDIITTTKMRNPIPPITIPRDPVTPIQTSTHPLEVTHSSKEPSNSSAYSQAPRNRGESDDIAPNGSILVGISIVATLAAVLLLGLSYLFIKRYRKNRKRRSEAHIDQRHEEHNDYGVNKPELDGSQPERMKNWRKAELDANATRAELEAHVLPAELDGVPRAELEAYPTIIRMKPAKSLSITNH